MANYHSLYTNYTEYSEYPEKHENSVCIFQCEQSRCARDFSGVQRL